MPLKAHLIEFRNRLMVSAAAIVLGAIVAWIIYPTVYEQLTLPFTEYKRANPDSVVTLNFGNATSAFTTQLGLSLFTGVILASPIWVWQIWAFILPGLTKREKRMSLGVFGTALPLFLAGCFFAYQTLPKALLILFGFTPDDNKSSNIQQASDYFTFITRFILAFGLAWLLPVFLVGLEARIPGAGDAIAALATGAAEGCLDAALDYAQSRQVFGERLGSRQSIQFMIARMQARVHTARLAWLHAARLRDEGRPFGPEAAIAKLTASDAAMDNARDATQIFGGNGFMEEYPVARFYRDAKILEIGEGTSEVQLLVISRALGLDAGRSVKA